ncbi:shikimate dehydrogenase [Antrihabitans sp. YC2-6]|uniref:shikimate dehydrogenase n=1 Tax=Antrihabitans sp. YC2-6 TaxID=2799498 RepID=UPI0018F7AE45|nr:shikimate dehydrogenase [Antrihabitans sp. YC2-6]MBJ8345289.1 shikimate dehydrogenase [Antrihabitans sp. YC2-6]
MAADTARKAAVLGSPIQHSRSPDLHLAAYRALGLPDWTYERIECPAGCLRSIVRGLGDDYVGLSVTMPGKAEALAFASERTERAVLVGSANTLVRIESGWRADCTDVDGVRGALVGGGVGDLSGGSAVVIGAGGTARPAMLALAELGVTSVAVVARSAARAQSAIDLAGELRMSVRFVDFGGEELAAACGGAAVVVSTAPADAIAPVADSVARAPFVLDAIYNPWPTPLAAAVEGAGGTVVSGLQMLLNQAFGQVEQFTGLAAPRAEMAAVLGFELR